MKAVQFNEYGGPEVLKVVDINEPHPGPNQVRIAVRAAGENPSDLMKIRAGIWKDKPIPLPFGVGVEGAGVVDEVGECFNRGRRLRLRNERCGAIRDPNELGTNA